MEVEHPPAVVPRLGTAPAAPSPLRSAADLAAAYLAGFQPATRAAYERDLRSWETFLTRVFGIEPLTAHRAHVDAYMRQLDESEGLAASTRARRWTVLAG